MPEIEQDKIYPIECPICGIATNYSYRIDDGKDTSQWFNCPCGVIFQRDKPANDIYDEKYISDYAEHKDVDLINIHAARLYAPLIEELTYGRKLLDVGFNLPYNINYFQERGWICTAIDVNNTIKDRKNVINADFENFEFKDEFNLIWMAHVFEHFVNPIKALDKVFRLMPEDGVLYIATPDIDFITKTGVSNYPHWKKREHYVLWSERALKREVERMGFKVVLSRRNFCSRFTAWYDIHLICQKRFF